jgi:hypothetical protein
MNDNAFVIETALTDADPAPWSLAEERLTNSERERTYWLASVRPDGSPHVMPLIGAWMEGAVHFLSGEKTRKARNLANEPRCVLAVRSSALPSLDLIIEGSAERISDGATLRRVVDHFSIALTWPDLELRDGLVFGPNAPTAGPPPYAVFRVRPTTVFGLPGTAGMDQFAPEDLPRPTRWDLGSRPQG